MTVFKPPLPAMLLLWVCSAALFGQATAPPAKETEKQTRTPDTVLAEIRGKKLTLADVKAIQKYLVANGTEQQIIEFWKLRAVLADEMRKSGLLDNPEIKAAVDFASTAHVAHLYLAASRLDVTVTEKEVREYYEKHNEAAEFRQPDVVTVKLIAAKEREPLLELQKRLIAGEDFDIVMNENRDETLKVTGLSDVVIKEVSAKDLQPSLGFQWQSLMTVQVDQPIGPMKTPTGWAIYKVIQRTPGAAKPFDEVRPSLEQRLLQQKRSEVEQNLTTYARKEAGLPVQAPTTRRVPSRAVPTTRPSGK